MVGKICEKGRYFTYLFGNAMNSRIHGGLLILSEYDITDSSCAVHV